MELGTLSNVSEPMTIAALIAVAMGMMEIIKQLVSWIGEKIKGEKEGPTVMVQLDPEVSRLIHETGDQVKSMAAVVFRTDADGVPLVYSDRKAEQNVERLATLMNDLVEAQRRLADSMARLDRSFEAHDKSDAIIFARMSDAQTRLESIGISNRESLIEFKKDHQNALQALDKIQRDNADHDRRVMAAVAMQQEILAKVK